MRNSAKRFWKILLLTVAVSVTCVPVRALAQLQFEQWKSLQFAPSENSDPLVSGLTADPDRDSIRNLFEYGLAGNPKVAAISPLPTVDTVNDRLVLGFTRVKSAIDLTYVVEVSHNLVNWYSGEAFTEPFSTLDLGETEFVRIQDRTPTSSLGKRFIRLRLTQLPIDTGLRLWLDAGARVTKDGANLVSALGDGSGVANDASQATPAKQPLWIDNVINGRPVLRFDGINDQLIATLSPGTDNFTVFVVAKTTAAHEIDTEGTTGTAGTSGQKYLFGATSSGVNAGAGMSLGTNGISIYENGNSYMPPLAVYGGSVGNGFVLGAFEYEARRPTIFLNGQLLRPGLVSPRPQVSAPTEIGAGAFGAFAGDIAEIMIYNRALSADERAIVEAYLSRKYALHIIPEVTITDPQNASVFATQRVDVHGQVVHASAMDSLMVNGVRALVTGNSFEARSVPLAAGANTVTAIATDIFGHIASSSIIITQGSAPVDPVTLQANSTSGFGPLSITFQASATVPGQILEVRYDFDGDGIVDLVAYNLNPVTRLYSVAGDFFPVVTIVTTAGSFSSFGGFFSQFPGRMAIRIQAPPQQESLTSIADPVDVKWMPDGSLYVLARAAAKVIQFAANGTTVRSITGIGVNPSGIDVDSGGLVYVALTGNNQVARLKPSGGTFAFDPLFNGTGKIGRTDGVASATTGEFNQPYDVAVSSDGQHVYVSDTGNHRIQKFTSAGVFETVIGEPGNQVGQFNAPKGISYSSDGNIYVADAGNNRIAVINDDNASAAFGQQGTGPLQFQNPVNVSADSSGIYVADLGNNRIVAIKRPVRFSNEYTSAWTSGGAIVLSGALSVAAAGTLLEDRIYIADTGNNQIQKFLLPKASPDPVWTNTKANLAAGNIEAAVGNFVSSRKNAYRDIFASLGSAALTRWMNQIGPLIPVIIEENTAESRFEIMQGTTAITFLVIFAKENGQWKIVEF